MSKCFKCGDLTSNNKFCEECLLDIESIRGLDDDDLEE
jgi:hypothetical protein